MDNNLEQIIDEDQGLVRVTTIHGDGRKHTMWYGSMETFEAEKKAGKEAADKFWDDVIWGRKK